MNKLIDTRVEYVTMSNRIAILEAELVAARRVGNSLTMENALLKEQLATVLGKLQKLKNDSSAK